MLVFSTMHYDDKIDPSTGDMLKPEIITFYNVNKGGVDVVDELKMLYSTARFSCRWSLTVFFGIMNIGPINAQIIYHKNTNTVMPRRQFLKCLAFELMKPQLLKRAECDRLSFELRKMAAKVAGIPEVRREVTEGFCAECPRRKNRKTKKYCKKCEKAVCNEHTVFLCEKCFEDDE